MRKLLIVAAAAVAAGVLAQTAAADPPVVVERNATVTRVFPGLTDCQSLGYAFTFTARYVVRRTHLLYHDRTGVLVREVIYAHFVGTNTNDANGTSLPDNGRRHITIDYVDNTFTESGVLRHVTVAGSGIVLHESGRLVFSLTDDSLLSVSGPHQLFRGDLAEFCHALYEAAASGSR